VVQQTSLVLNGSAGEAVHVTSSAPASTTGLVSAPAGRAWQAVVITVVLWASAFVVIRIAAPVLDAGPLALGRLVVGALTLTVMVAVRARRSPVRTPHGRAWLLVLVFGVLWFGVYNVALNAAEHHLDAGTSAMLVNVAPVIVALLAGGTLGEGFPRPLLVGIGIAFVGVAVIAYATSTGRYDIRGVGLALLAAVTYAIGVVSQKRLLGSVDALVLTWLGCLVGVVVTLPFAPALVAQLAAAGTGGWLAMVYLGVFPTALAFSTWAYALQRMTAGRLAATTYVVPALAVVISWVALGETPAALALTGGAVCLVGVACTRLPDRRRG
jgi:drug/metabolite transporter (DMT)-like permease